LVTRAGYLRRGENDVLSPGGNRQDRRSTEQETERLAEGDRVERGADSVVERNCFGRVGQLDTRVGGDAIQCVP